MAEENGGIIGRVEDFLQTVSDWTGIPVDFLKKGVGLSGLFAVIYVVLKIVFGRKS